MTSSLHHTWLPTHPLLISILWPTLYITPNFTPTLSLFLFHDQLFTSHLTSHPPSPDFYFMSSSLQPSWLPTHPLLTSILWPTLYSPPDFPPTLSWFHDQLFTSHLTSHPPSPYFYFMANSLQPTWLPTHPLLILWPALYSPPNFPPTLSWFHDQLFTSHLTSHPPSPDFMTSSLHHTWLHTHPLLVSITWPTLYSPPNFPPTLSWFLLHDQLFTALVTSHPPSPDFMTSSLQPS